MERNLQEPFFQAELARCEFIKRGVKGPVVGILAALTLLLNWIINNIGN